MALEVLQLGNERILPVLVPYIPEVDETLAAKLLDRLPEHLPKIIVASEALGNAIADDQVEISFGQFIDAVCRKMDQRDVTDAAARYLALSERKDARRKVGSDVTRAQGGKS